MNQIIEEVIEYLKSWDINNPTKDDIKNVLNTWINNLYSHIGIEAHQHALSCGIIDETEMSLEEQDMYMLQQIDKYKQCIMSIE